MARGVPARPRAAQDLVASATQEVREAEVHLARLTRANQQRDHVLSALAAAAVRACLEAASEQLTGMAEAGPAIEAQDALENAWAEAEPHLARAYQPRSGAYPFATGDDQAARAAWVAGLEEALDDGATRAQGGALVSAGAVSEIAARGVGGAPRALPHLSLIQASFGSAHDVSRIGAHMDDAAATASAQLGADAFAVGEQVAFSRAPDLHTAAHEAARYRSCRCIDVCGHRRAREPDAAASGSLRLGPFPGERGVQ